MIALVITSQALAGPGDTDDWYVFSSTDTTSPGVFGMQDWLDAPAGNRGRIIRRGGDLMYAGEPIRIWGINNTFADCAPDKALAEKRAAFYAKYGINSVRLHKYGEGSNWRGILSNSSFTEFEPESLDRMDYFIAQLKERGIFVKLSQSFGPPRLMPEDRNSVPYVEEFGTFEKGNGSIQVPHSSIFYSPEIQSVHIRQMVHLLDHRNPYTGIRYADDPAIWDIEIINEQSILFYTSANGLKESPTLRRIAGMRFSAWLVEKYGDEDGLVSAWGRKALGSFDLAGDEILDEKTVLPIGNPYYWNRQTLAGPENWRKQRHLDTLEFLTMLQKEFYESFIEAVRETGYDGEISGSNWQAGSSFSHFANLWTDATVGTIDRHNYFGGMTRKRQGVEQAVNNNSMLAKAGTGMLSTGMQQVAARPFMLSEWIHVWPNEWGVEGPAIIGAYGLGLQGWDASYMFQNKDNGGFSEVLGSHNWDVTTPQVMGIFPAVARQVLRGDVRQSTERATLKVHASSLFLGAGYDFIDQVDQGYDDKVLQSDKVGPAALAVVKVETEFTTDPAPTIPFSMDARGRDGSIRSSTGQLTWVEASPGNQQDGHITIKTDGTLAIVGFAAGESVANDAAKLKLESGYAAVYLTALGANQTLATDHNLLLTAIARARNTGQAFDETGQQLLSSGSDPVLMEPVRLRLTMLRGGKFTVTPLDHDGMVRKEAVPATGQTVVVDTVKWKTPYFLVAFE